MVVVLIIAYSALLIYTVHSNSTTTTNMLLELIDNKPELAGKFKSVDTITVLISVIGMGIATLIITYIGIFSTHKVAGPIYRFKKHLSSIKEGNFSVRTYLRKNDMLNELADDFNQASEKLKEFVENDIVFSEDVCRKIQSIQSQLDQQSIGPDELSEALNGLQTDIEDFIKTKKLSIGMI
ncbi:MAG: methyl-accepting chemotaxis protein [Candidatus Auribacter fodinae]|jgi:methyl-accepting chemotaxis protein|uniref:Methyl-accepting chemotaxis protein n=1 Tax=Candidatus Auribacter fodinae TaxID=2093366 RepID=A0A3A4QX04_9BACT|nr:MAG: methyl-accepting chemotaxis protein [Candidatus Auribacter fodinae]